MNRGLIAGGGIPKPCSVGELGLLQQPVVSLDAARLVGRARTNSWDADVGLLNGLL
jgi:hypothetical protein